ncbi:hypothetical protein Acsp04_38090 [Actinomadura sp. NBRC 104425]|nr:hypothetical protein Acsp04_38090 [Actinomadura sp. NBRC 104425]
MAVANFGHVLGNAADGADDLGVMSTFAGSGGSHMRNTDEVEMAVHGLKPPPGVEESPCMDF